mmetsp:Transcript_122996/g.347628  ORF Transcript_122996/g.347628 Transcript_122996/m.347628 type:complete len:219 (-) Transcript_122996:71-727(-)
MQVLRHGLQAREALTLATSYSAPALSRNGGANASGDEMASNALRAGEIILLSFCGSRCSPRSGLCQTAMAICSARNHASSSLNGNASTSESATPAGVFQAIRNAMNDRPSCEAAATLGSSLRRWPVLQFWYTTRVLWLYTSLKMLGKKHVTASQVPKPGIPPCSMIWWMILPSSRLTSMALSWPVLRAARRNAATKSEWRSLKGCSHEVTAGSNPACT